MSNKNILVSEAFHSNINSNIINYNSGTLSQSFNLGTIYNGLESNEPAFNLNLSHVQGKNITHVYDLLLGWEFNIPKIDVYNKRLSLSNGISSSFTLDGNDLILTSHKLKNLKIEYISDDEYRVIHIDGTIENFKKKTYQTYLIDTIIDKYGRSIKFLYIEDFAVETFCIAKIYSIDNPTSSIDIDYDIKGITIIESNGNLTREASISFIHDDNFRFILTAISKLGDPEFITTFTSFFSPISGLTIQNIGISNIEEIAIQYINLNYDDENYVAAISKITTRGFNDDEELIYNYSYSQNNYTGYSPGITKITGEDNCILRTDDYKYHVIEMSPGNLKTDYEFNKFHSLVKKIESLSVKDSVERVEVEYIYNTVPGNIFTQPENYKLPKSEKKTIGSGYIFSSFINETVYDVFGNLTYEKKPYKDITYEYYNPDSTIADGCPPDRYNYFVKNVKKITERAISNPNNINKKEFTYISVAINASESVTMPYSFMHNGLTLRRYEYLDHRNGNRCIGLVSRLTSFNPPVHTLGDDVLPPLADLITTYTYTTVGSETTIVETTKSGDNISKSSYIVIDDSHHLKVVKQQEHNGTVAYTNYDLQGRVLDISKISNSGQKEFESFIYGLNVASPYGIKNTVTHTDSSGRTLTYYFNAYNNLTHLAEGDTLLKSQEYINKKIAKITEHDVTINVEIPTQYEHCLFGISKITYSDGKINNIKYHSEGYYAIIVSDINGNVLSEKRTDFLDRIISLRINGTEIESYSYNDVFDEPTKIVKRLYDSHIENTFDRFGRKIAIKNYRSGNIESIVEYDYQSPQFDSPCRVILTGVNSQPIIYELRDHDSFGRVFRQAESDASGYLNWRIKNHYANSYDEIPSEVYYYNNKCKEQRLSALHNKIKEQIIYSDNGEVFKYLYEYNQSGFLTSSEEFISTDKGNNYLLRSKYSNFYNNRNILTNSNFTIDGRVYNLEQVVSPSDNLIHIKNHFGYKQCYYYNSVGKLTRKNYENIGILIDATYNPVGDLVSLDIIFTDINDRKFNQNINFEYSGIGMISAVDTKIFVDGDLLCGIKSSNEYDNNGNILLKTITREDGNVTSEKYSYLGTSPSLNTYSKDNETFTYNYMAPEMISTITKGNHQLFFQASYQEDAATYIYANQKNNNFNIDYMENITNNERWDYISYDRDNRVISSRNHSGTETTNYHYNPSERISSIVSSNSTHPINYIYLGDHLLGEVCGETKSMYITFGNFKIGRVIKDDSAITTFELFGIDSQNTVLMMVSDDGNNSEVQYYKYDPHGTKEAWL